MDVRPDRPEGLSAVLRAFQPSTEALLELSDQLASAIAARLEGRKSSLKVLETHAGLPDGSERGPAVVVDWGGTNGRAALLELGDEGKVSVLAQQHVAFTEEDKLGPLEHVLGRLTECVRAVAPRDGRVPLSFVYSFPARLEALDSAIALPLTKGWNPVGLEGSDVVAAFRDSLGRGGLGHVEVLALANDTVAPLLLSTWRARSADPGALASDLGMILGTGHNLAADLGTHGIRNLESGNFDGVAAAANVFDDELDAQTKDPLPGAQRLEKMISGEYLGELLRRALHSAAEIELDPASAAVLERPFGLPTRWLSDWVEREPDSPRGRLALAIGRRSAQLAAAAVWGVVRFVDPSLARPHRVAVDGSLYGRFPGYRAWLFETLQDLALPKDWDVEVVFENESTQAGAAVLAAWAARR